MRVTLSFKTIGCFLVLFSLPSPPVQAQLMSDSTGPDSRLFNGYEYIRNGIPAKGFPFFASDSLERGSLCYDGILYPEIPLEYDLVQDKVIIHDLAGKALISLISEKVGYFTIGTHRFRYVEATSTMEDAPGPGFYEVLYVSGPLTLFARHEKQLQFPTSSNDQARYYATSHYFLNTNDRFYRVDGIDALVKALQDKRDALKKYIRENKIHFKKQPEAALIQVTAYYRQISF
jgi:hypothetical protein